MKKRTGTCLFYSKQEDKFLKRLVEMLGPVLIGVKPSEVLSFPMHDDKIDIKIEKVKKHIGCCKKIQYKMFIYKNKSIKILFYNSKSLDVCLRDKRNQKFLKNLGYPKDYTMESYLDFLINKIKAGKIPDEIGVFLGYPLKDIIGFIGHPSLKLTKINGWRVYGDSRLSDKKFSEFSKAKNTVRNLLNQYTPEKVLLYV
ncbi:DUF3793 family protein [Thermohalobacter berrensis]|uniref:DUF3793 domain-containing protein n=1 Tax=Thermohalobacter berrensis TaxID=99594 RepID=A0A419SU36_9FIRM|nr:DUF3793 family protein [Thermohalobacter berrensis]RKD28760.1 hypothetical protein BET03_06890 [Thermohalobacter berrensis]